MTNQIQSSKLKTYNLGERTAAFGENIIGFASLLPDNSVNKPLTSQVVRAGTSVGANYMEADSAESKKDFKHKMSLCKKEAKETLHWPRMIAKANLNLKNQCRELWKEAHELALIFSSIVIKLK